MYTKPCARAGCSLLVVAKTPRLLRKRKYHSLPCFYQHKRDMGWSVTPNYTLAQRKVSGRKGGLTSASTRRRRAVLRHVHRIAGLMPEVLVAKLTQREQTLITLLLVRAYERGRENGVFYERVRQTRSFVEQARKRATAA